MDTVLKFPLSNVQLELLHLFSDGVPDEELKEVKKILTAWRFKRLREAAAKVWDEKGWTDADMERLLEADLRTPYRSQNEFLAKTFQPQS